MKIKYILICLLANISFANAQYQNFDLNTNDDAESKTYVGRDYVRLQNGYSFSATKSGKTLNAKVQSGLTPAEVTTFVSIANPTNSPTITPEILTAINTGMAVGQIPISSSVSPNGAKCYNVPIEIVPGRLGFQPNISLSYNSQAGNGVVGMGWNISGLSSIERVNKNMFYDGINSNLDLEGDIKNGVFELDGVRLILKNFQQTSSITWIANYETIQENIIVTANIDIYYNINFTVKYPMVQLEILGLILK